MAGVYALRHAADRIDVAVRALRNLITDLRPPVLDDHGLEPALKTLAERLRSVSGLTVDLQVELGDESGPQTRLAHRSRTPSSNDEPEQLEDEPVPRCTGRPRASSPGSVGAAVGLA